MVVVVNSPTGVPGVLYVLVHRDVTGFSTVHSCLPFENVTVDKPCGVHRAKSRCFPSKSTGTTVYNVQDSVWLFQQNVR